MSLGVIPMFWFEFLRILVKNRKKERTRKTGHHGPLRYSEGHPRRGEVLRRSKGLPRRNKAKGPEKAPSCSPRRSLATLRRSASPRRRHCSQRQKFYDFVPKASYSCTDSLSTLINY